MKFNVSFNNLTNWQIIALPYKYIRVIYQCEHKLYFDKMKIILPSPRQLKVDNEIKRKLRNSQASNIYYQCHFCDHKEGNLEKAEKHQRKCYSEQSGINKSDDQKKESNNKLIVHSYQKFRALKKKRYVLSKTKSISKACFLRIKKFDMLTFLKLKRFPIMPKKISIGHRIFFKCSFCKLISRSIRELYYHQDNSHFLQIENLRLYITKKISLDRKSTTQNRDLLAQKPKNYHLIQFNPYFRRLTFRLFKCNFCSFVDHRQLQTKRHTQNLCQQRHIAQILRQKSIQLKQIELKTSRRYSEQGIQTEIANFQQQKSKSCQLI